MSSPLRAKLEQQLNAAWYGGESSLLSKALRPLSVIYRTGFQISEPNEKDVYNSPMPVIVVGNIVVGGAGKTPLVIALCEKLIASGHKPAVLSRGYGATAERFPHMVADRDLASEVGDEPKLLHSRLNIPVCIDPERSRGARYLLAHNLCDVIVLDDGLQHRKLARDLEIAVIDGHRLLGNGLCLPAGPLREPKARLDTVDFVLMNGEPELEALKKSGITHYDGAMLLKVDGLVNVATDERLSMDAFMARAMERTPIALCGIANPQRFFQSLKKEGVEYVPRPFPDHHDFSPSDFAAAPGQAVIMTEKDAVKCRAFVSASEADLPTTNELWYLQVSAELPKEFCTAFMTEVERAFKRHS